MTKIRLARFGSRHQPHYRIVAADSRSPRNGRFLESLGSFNPKAGTVQLNVERVEYWISVGAQPTNTTISLLTKGGVKHSFVVAKKPLRKKEAEVAKTDETVVESPVSDEAAQDQSEEPVQKEETSEEAPTTEASPETAS